MSAIHQPYHNLISLENLFAAWHEFRAGKKSRLDVQLFERYLEDNLCNLHEHLRDKTYQHGPYQAFYVHDPKRRHIHKASIADRVVHHLLYKFLYDLFDPIFIHDSYSCRLGKGTHKGVVRLQQFIRQVSKNHTQSCYVLHGDIAQFFASVDHAILSQLLKKHLHDTDILRLLQQVIDSFHIEQGRGVPLGNLTSQVFANIYLNELDQFVKHTLKEKYYIRYADDFVILSPELKYLYGIIPTLKVFLHRHLQLSLHQRKVTIRKYTQGIDFLGYVLLPHAIVPRTKTKRRVFSKLHDLSDSPTFDQSLQSYLGYLSHSNSYKLTQRLKNQVWLWRNEII